MKQKGFTIIELIIAIFVLCVAIIGVYSAFSVLLVLTTNSADRLTAAYLAQEGVEIVRNIRDTNWFKVDNGEAENWFDGLSDCANGCQADYTSVINGETPVLTPYVNEPDQGHLNVLNGFYSYASGGSPTKFKRKITITCPPDDDCSVSDFLDVSVQVFWDEKATILNSGTTDNSVTVQENLYDWY